jgi:hypothetical protein
MTVVAYPRLMPATRLELALSLIQWSDWRAFEKFASEFISPEYPSFRTTATASGDGGRDGEIYLADEDPTVAFQFSVTVDWQAKIKQTVSRLSTTFPDVDELIYVTNQVVGAGADALKKALRKDSKLSLDVRDRHWFVERENTYPQRSIASEKLAEQFVNPLLARNNLSNVSPRLSGDDGRIALLQLTLDARDHLGDRNLTKSCFQSLTIAALRGTSSELRLTREQIHQKIQSLVPAGAPGQLEALANGALERLSRKQGPVKFIRSSDEFHLSFQESKRLAEQTAAYILDEKELESELAAALCAMEPDSFDSRTAMEASTVLREILEDVLLRRGEAFASALQSGESVQLDASALLDEITAIGRTTPVSDKQAAATILRVLDSPSSRMNAYLRRLSDSYTLFAFLRQTPDVQKVVLSIFSEGSIWLDTSAILPLIGESIIDDHTRRHYTQLLRSAVDAGISLHATPGVIEEVERHLNRCVAFSRSTRESWNGRTPFIYSAYILSGRSSTDFLTWQDQIRGRERPEEDVQDYLEEVFSISTVSLEEIADGAPIELRAAVQELWMEQHDRRRGAGDDYSSDPGTIARLVAHDVENTVGIIQMRKNESRSPMGYKSWWLTMDKTALRIKSYLDNRMGESAPKSSPALSADFLSQYFQLGPMRAAIERDLHVGLPIMTDISRLENVPRDLIELADRVRAENADSDERVIRRKVRDTLDSARAKQGAATVGGIKELEKNILGEIAEQRSASAS